MDICCSFVQAALSFCTVSDIAPNALTACLAEICASDFFVCAILLITEACVRVAYVLELCACALESRTRVLERTCV